MRKEFDDVHGIARIFSPLAVFAVCLLASQMPLQASPQDYATSVDLGPGNEDAARQLLNAMLGFGKKVHPKDKNSFWKDFSLDLSGRDLRNSTIHASWDAVHNVNFDDSDLSESNFEETRFENCSFRNAKLRNVDLFSAGIGSCDLTNADISGCNIGASQRQLVSTLNFKRKNLSNLSLWVNVAGVDFSGFDLRHSFLAKSKFTNCDFTDAKITGSYVNLDAEQLRSTF